MTVDGADGLSAMSCPSTSRCYALDDAGRIATSSNPATSDAAWSAFPVANLANPFSGEAISCPAVLSLCVASDVTLNPQQGHYVRTIALSTHASLGTQAWRSANLSFLADGSSCPSKRLCVAAAGNDIVTSTRPTVPNSWILHGVEPGSMEIAAVTCPSLRLCVAVDEHGNVLTTTHPAGSAHLWKIRHVDSTKDSAGQHSSLYAVSCPATRLCIAFDRSGNVLSSRDPTGGAHAWRLAQLPGATEAKYMTCPSTTLCVGIDEGNIATVTNPASRDPTWAVANIDPNSYVTSLSCPSASLCVAGDAQGDVLIGRPTA